MPVLSAPQVPVASPLDDADPLCRVDATTLAALYARGDASPVEVVRAALARAEAVQARLNAFTHLDPDGALDAARASEARWRNGRPLGPLDGVPATIKDLVWAAGWTIRAGSHAPGLHCTEDAPAMARLRAAGVVPIGLTTTPEFGWKAVTDSPFSGVTRNPWNPERTPGGSSGGAAVAAATGAGVLHLGTDGGGSIRIPAAFTGVVGHKPTFGRVPAYPASPFGTVAHLGPITRTVADAALMLDVLSGRDLRDWNQNPLPFRPAASAPPVSLAGMRLGVWQTPPQGCARVTPEVETVFAAALRRLEAAGARLEPVDLPGADGGAGASTGPEASAGAGDRAVSAAAASPSPAHPSPAHGLLALFHDLWFSGAAGRLRALSQEALAGVDPGLREIAAAGARLSATDLIAANTRRAAFGAAFEALAARYDLLVSPAAALTAFAAGEEVPPGSGLARWTEWAGFSFPVNLAQLPACVLPCGLTADGLPAGLQLIGVRGDDDRVLATARACEEVLAREEVLV